MSFVRIFKSKQKVRECGDKQVYDHQLKKCRTDFKKLGYQMASKGKRKFKPNDMKRMKDSNDIKTLAKYHISNEDPDFEDVFGLMRKAIDNIDIDNAVDNIENKEDRILILNNFEKFQNEWIDGYTTYIKEQENIGGI